MNIYTKLILNIIRNRLCQIISICYTSDTSVENLVRQIMTYCHQHQSTLHILANEEKTADMLVKCLDVVVPINLKMANQNPLYGNFDRNIKLWETVFQTKEYIEKKNDTYGIVVYITTDNYRNMVTTFSPLIDGKNETRIVRKSDGTLYFIGNHSIKWMHIKENGKMCVITLKNEHINKND